LGKAYTYLSMQFGYNLEPLKVHLLPEGGKDSDALVAEDFTPKSLKFFVNREKGVALVIFGDAKVMNAFRVQLHWEVHLALEHAKRDPGIKAVVWTGDGDKAFSSGADFAESFGRPTVDIPPRVLEQYEARGCGPIKSPGFDVALKRLTGAFWRFPKPSLCAVNGLAVGFGANFVMCHDIAMAAPHARFRWPFCELAIVPEMGSSMLLAQRVGINKAKELVYAGTWMSAEEALRYGLVNAIFPANVLLPETLAVAEQIAKNSPTSLRLSKQLFHAHVGCSLDDVIDAENKAMKEAMASEEFQTSIAKFVAKHRKPAKL